MWVGIAASLLGQAQSLQTAMDGAAVAKNPALSSIRVDQHLGAQVPPQATFKDEQGNTVKLAQYFGSRPVILLPIFYQCTGVCNLELQGILATLKSMNDLKVGKDFDFLIVSINPTETPAMAAGKKQNILDIYERKESAPGWHLMSGDMENIRMVTDAIGFQYTYNAKENIVNHPSCLVVLTPRGTASTYFLGVTYEASEIRNAIALAKKSRVGIKAESVFLGCVHVDPITGKRSVVIENVLKLAGIVTVLAVALSIVTMSVRSRRREI